MSRRWRGDWKMGPICWRCTLPDRSIHRKRAARSSRSATLAAEFFEVSSLSTPAPQEPQMISLSPAETNPASTRGQPPSELGPEAHEIVEAAADESINIRRALEENIEILRRGRAL
jgi:hypothetical protein